MSIAFVARKLPPFFALLVACRPDPVAPAQPTAAAQDPVDLLAQRLVGRFDSVDQAAAAPDAGASYATSQVTITAQYIESWDRGFAADDRQVWGADQGPYRFARRSP